MRIKNYTKIEATLIREVVAFVRPPGVAGFDLTIKNSSNGDKGYAYSAGCYWHDRLCPLVTIGIDPRSKYPRRIDCGRGYLPSIHFSAEDMLVHLIAHELRHLWQARVPRGRRVWGARGQFSERDADAYAIRMTRAWRRRPPRLHEGNATIPRGGTANILISP